MPRSSVKTSQHGDDRRPQRGADSAPRGVGSPSILVREPPAVHASPDCNDERISSPSDPDSDLILRKLGKKCRSKICPHDAEAPFNKAKQPQPLGLTRCPPPTSNGDGYQQPESELQSRSDHGQWNGNQRQPEAILAFGKQRTEGEIRALCRDVHLGQHVRHSEFLVIQGKRDVSHHAANLLYFGVPSTLHRSPKS
jgi:hypothetical protein